MMMAISVARPFCASAHVRDEAHQIQAEVGKLMNDFRLLVERARQARDAFPPGAGGPGRRWGGERAGRAAERAHRIHRFLREGRTRRLRTFCASRAERIGGALLEPFASGLQRSRRGGSRPAVCRQADDIAPRASAPNLRSARAITRRDRIARFHTICERCQLTPRRVRWHGDRKDQLGHLKMTAMPRIGARSCCADQGCRGLNNDRAYRPARPARRNFGPAWGLREPGRNDVRVWLREPFRVRPDQRPWARNSRP